MVPSGRLLSSSVKLTLFYCWHVTRLMMTFIDMGVTLLSGSTLATGQCMQSTCIYWLSAYTRVRFTDFTTESVSHCYSDGEPHPIASIRLLLLAVHGASHQSGEKKLQEIWLPNTNGT